MKIFFKTIVFLFLLTSCVSYNTEVDENSLFIEYYKNDIIDIRRSVDNDESIIAFQEKDFQKASYLFDSILNVDSNNIAVMFYNSMSNIELGHYANAIKLLKEIIKTDNLYVEHAEWYLGLCYLKLNEIDKAIYQFNVVAVDSINYHQQSAIEILLKLHKSVDSLDRLNSTYKKIESQNIQLDSMIESNQ